MVQKDKIGNKKRNTIRILIQFHAMAPIRVYDDTCNHKSTSAWLDYNGFIRIR